ncbi:signal peptidase II [Fulvivirgaceae bacterium BMA10]|uniref:Lipoprotein signal peptidase n=1 Tax=Splendidivirga corallicola TaxID=3051826 RepID=A0ABT8KRD4_9BACT|nr:signal peptidase II [Fulvivirgaceae bacterium BMA10]
MKSTMFIRILIILLLVFVNIGCDQISKSVARENIEYHEHIEVIGNHLILTKVENTGAFLGLGSSLHPVLKYFLLLILPSLVLIILLGILIAKPQFDRPVIVALTFIIGGGIGNMIDRFAYGSVTDFLHIDFEIFRTGIFNMADVSVMAGTIIIVLYSILMNRKKSKVEQAH